MVHGQSPAEPLSSDPTHRQPVSDEQHDAGQEHAHACVDDQRPADRFVANAPGDHADDRAGAEEQVVEADAECPESDGRHVGGSRASTPPASSHVRPANRAVPSAGGEGCGCVPATLGCEVQESVTAVPEQLTAGSRQRRQGHIAEG